jgi:hypothetical protein
MDCICRAVMINHVLVEHGRRARLSRIELVQIEDAYAWLLLISSVYVRIVLYTIILTASSLLPAYSFPPIPRDGFSFVPFFIRGILIADYLRNIALTCDLGVF